MVDWWGNDFFFEEDKIVGSKNIITESCRYEVMFVFVFEAWENHFSGWLVEENILDVGKSIVKVWKKGLCVINFSNNDSPATAKE